MIWTQIIVGILSSILAAGLFLYLLSKLRPEIEISEHIAKSEQEGKTKYSIKILNKSKRDAINLRIEADLLSAVIVPNGSILTSQALVLKKPVLMVLPKNDKRDTDANYAFRLVIDEPIDKLWQDESTQFIRVKIFAQDEMSNFGKVFEREYRTKRNSIKEGQFKFGDTLEVA